QACDQLAAPRGSGPANVAELVAFLIFTQAFEFTPGATDAGMAFFHFDLAAANQINGLLARLFEVGINTDPLLHMRHGPALRKTQRSLVANIDSAEFGVAAASRNHSISRS